MFFVQGQSATGGSMKDSIITFAGSEYQKIKHNPALNPQDRLYQLSMPLLAYATMKQITEYQTVLADMQQILDNETDSGKIQKSWQLWMLGRMAVAAKLAGDQQKLSELKTTLSKELSENDTKDIFTGWAFAYLASLDQDTYKQYQAKLSEYDKLERARFDKDPEKEGSNYVWTVVMNLYAAASTNQDDDYAMYKEELINLTPQKSLTATSQLVPMSDFRQWLISFQRYSFTMMQDKASLGELQSINSPTIESLDSMLAWANTLITPENLSLKDNPNTFYAAVKTVEGKTHDGDQLSLQK